MLKMFYLIVLALMLACTACVDPHDEELFSSSNSLEVPCRITNEDYSHTVVYCGEQVRENIVAVEVICNPNDLEERDMCITSEDMAVVTAMNPYFGVTCYMVNRCWKTNPNFVLK
jgi:hypothetical protein